MSDITFEHSEGIRVIARELISKHHSHLVEANFLFLIRRGPWKVNRKTRWGSAEKTSAKVKFLAGDADFIITINGDIWPYLFGPAQRALVDHELTHCQRGEDDADGNPTWYVQSHDLEDFSAVIRRHGLWAEDLKLFSSALEDHKNQQMELFDEQSPLRLAR